MWVELQNIKWQRRRTRGPGGVEIYLQVWDEGLSQQGDEGKISTWDKAGFWLTLKTQEKEPWSKAESPPYSDCPKEYSWLPDACGQEYSWLLTH